jgi:hypothetical protein
VHGVEFVNARIKSNVKGSGQDCPPHTWVGTRGVSHAPETIFTPPRTDHATGRLDSTGNREGGRKKIEPPTLGIVYKFSIKIRPTPLAVSAGNIPGRIPDAPA